MALPHIEITKRNTRSLYVVIYTDDEKTRRIVLRGSMDNILSGEIKNHDVRKLIITKGTLECDDVLKLCGFLTSNRTAKYLDLSKNGINDIGATYLGNLLRYNNTLTELHLECNSISLKGAESICDGLKYNVGLTRLYLQKNPCGTNVCDLGIECLKYNISLKQLHFDSPWLVPNFRKLDRYLNENTLMSEMGSTEYHAAFGCIVSRPDQSNIKIPIDTLNLSTVKCTATKKIALLELLPKVLAHSDMITSLNLSNSALSHEACVELSTYISSSSNLKSLILRSCGIEMSGICAIGESLAKNASLIRLDLSMCFLGIALSVLMVHLKTNSSIRDLSLSGCNWNIGLPFVDYVNNPKFYLEKLNISGNKIDDVHVLSSALSTNATLTHLDLSNGSLQSSHELCVGHPFISFSNCLVVNKTLKYLDVSNNQMKNIDIFRCFCTRLQWANIEHVKLDRIGIKSEWCVYLRESLKRNTSITRVSLAYNNIEDLGVKYLCDGLISDECITDIDLSVNPITSDGITHIRDMLLSNKTITRLNYSEPRKDNRGMELDLEVNKFAKIDNEIAQLLSSNYMMSTLTVPFVIDATIFTCELPSKRKGITRSFETRKKLRCSLVPYFNAVASD